MTEEEYWYWFANIWESASVIRKRLLDNFGTPEEIYKASEIHLKKILNDDKNVSMLIDSKKKIDVNGGIEKLNSKEVKFIYYTHPDYPSKLKNICDPPYALYLKGKMPDKSGYSVAIVGARVCSQYGLSMAEKIGRELAQNNIDIISGMAKGVDGAAHMGAINTSRPTFAVLGCGPDVCYPRDNINIYAECIKNGGIISEYNIGKPPDPWRFPRRNRIISGLADIVIVVEARNKSGSLITVETALEQGKDVYAVPGRLGDKLSEGCNRIIAAGAGIYTSAEDILSELGFNLKNLKNEKNEISRKNELPLEKDLQVLYSCLDLFPKSIDSLIEETGYDIVEVMQLLVKLQMMDMICEPIKNYYVKKI